MEKALWIDYVSVYHLSIFASIDFVRWKSVGLLHIVYIVNNQYPIEFE